ncbi:unnamed protein product [marine sediment metagenome]|uniref:Uncharacterized protein n=1 Tax=marine sediment metagenome TaxID=412755 RepID=X1E6Z0_9ZZZZ
MKLVEVIWMDACIEEAHISKEIANALVALERRQVGYLYRETKGEVVLAYGTIENLFKKDSALDLVMAIPKGCIKEIRQLKEVQSSK